MTGTEAITRKRWKPRLWQLIVGTVAFLILACFVILLVMRANGRARWFAYVDAEQAAERPMTIDYFIAKAPPVDRRAQEAWDKWTQAIGNTRRAGTPLLTDLMTPQHRQAFAEWVTGHGPLPTAVQEFIASKETAYLPALAALRTGKLVLSTFGWAAEDLAPGRRGTLPYAGFLRGPNELITRGLAEWLRHHAVLSNDPTQDLSDLDALQTALARPATAYNAMIANGIAHLRDLTYLELAIRNQLPATAGERWLREVSRSLEMVGDGLLGDRILSADMYTVGFDVGLIRFMGNHINSSGGWRWSQLGDVAAMPWVWATTWDDLPLMTTYTGQMAASLRDESSAPCPSFAAFRNSLTLYGRYSTAPKMEFLSYYAIEAAEQEAGHRQARLAVRILALFRDSGLPTDQADLLARLGDAQALLVRQNRFTLRYERPAPDRFRLVIDPASPSPDFDDPRNMPARTKAAGSPPSASPLTTEPFVEIQVPPTP